MRGYTDAEADMLLAEALSAICVQRFDDSRNSAIHTTYRISLRSSSLREPRYPLLRVVISYCYNQVIVDMTATFALDLFCLVLKVRQGPTQQGHLKVNFKKENQLES